MTYIEKWYQTRHQSPTIAQQQAKELIDTISRSEGLQDLARRPLLLAIIALIHRVEVELPHERVKLYEKCVEALINTFEGAKRLSRLDADKSYYRYRREILEAVAFWMQTEHHGRDVLVAHADLKLYITRWLHEHPDYKLPRHEAEQQADAFIELVQQRTGLLVERGENLFNFVHLTFQEYLAAAFIRRNYILDINQMWEMIAPRLLNPNWREVLLLLLGQLSEFAKFSSTMVDRILATKDEDERILCRYLKFATDCIADNIRINEDLQEKIIAQWFQILRSPFCDHQIDLIMNSLNAVRGRSVVSHHFHHFWHDPSIDISIRLHTVGLYLQEIPIPQDVQQTLTTIATDENIAIEFRIQALNKLPIEIKHQIVHSLIQDTNNKTRLDSIALINYSYHKQFVDWFHNQNYELSDAHHQLKKVDSLYAWMATGDWEYPLLYLREAKEPGYELQQVLANLSDHFNHPLDSVLQVNLQTTLVEIIHRSQLYPTNIAAIHSLLLLDYPAEKLFDLVWEFDQEYDTDDWHIDTMTDFFVHLLTQLQDQTNAAQGNQSSIDEIVREWVNRIDSCQHATLQLSFTQALYRKNDDLASQLTLRLIEQQVDSYRLVDHFEWIESNNNAISRWLSEEIKDFLSRFVQQEPVNYGLVCALLRSLADRRLLNLEEFSTYFELLLHQTENPWARGSAVNYLLEQNLLNKDVAINDYLELTQQPTTSAFLKQSAAYQVAKLGTIEPSVTILRSVILDAQTPMEARNAAFDALAQIRQANEIQETIK